MSEDTTAKIDKKKKFRKRKREETEEDHEEEAELIKQRLEETKILQQFRLRNKGLEITVESGSASSKKKDESVQSLGEQFTSQSDIVDKLELKMHEYIEKRLANNTGGLVSSADMKNTSSELSRPSKAYTSEDESDRWMSGKNDNAGMVQEVELPSSYKQQNIEETEKARQKLKETSKTQEQAQDDVVPRFAKEKTVDQLSAKATDDIAFQRFKRKMPNNG
jgi:hypothetical protein